MNLGSADPCVLLFGVLISRLIDSGIRLRSFLSLKAEMKFARALGIDILVFQYVHPDL